MPNDDRLSQDFCHEHFVDSLRAFVGFGKFISVSALAELVGEAERTVRAHHKGEFMPSLATLLMYMRALPPGFAARVLAPAGLSVNDAADACDACEPLELLAHVTEHAAELSAMLKDGKLDHNETLELAQRIPELSQKLINFGSALNVASVRVSKIHAAE